MADDFINNVKTYSPASADITLGDASFNDMAEIEAIYSHHVLNTLVTMEEFPPSIEELNKRRLLSEEHGLPYIVAKKEEKLIGYCYALPFRPRSGYRFTVEDSIYIHPDYKGLGLGTFLLSELITQCRNKGCRQIVAAISHTSNPASIKLHSKLGFVNSGTLKAVGYKFNSWIDIVVMQKDLIE